MELSTLPEKHSLVHHFVTKYLLISSKYQFAVKKSTPSILYRYRGVTLFREEKENHEQKDSIDI